MAYSADFRNKVVQLYNSGTSTADLCAQFHISRSILYQWSEEAKVSNISKRDLATLQRHVATLENENSIYQKSLAALDLSIDNKVQIIDALKSEYSFYTLCRLLNLSKSTYINRQKSALIEKQLDVEDTLLKEKITIIFQKSDYRFGAKKIRANRNHPQGLTFHSDQGAQYTAFSSRQLLLDFNVHQSFSDIGNPLDNAVAESFFASLKKEQFKFHFYETVSELEESLSEYIDFYNDYRPHECLKQQTPNQFEESYQQQK